jgi:hypothetical protein
MYLHIALLSFCQTCCVRDVIVFATDEDTCELVGERLLENDIYTEECTSLQDELNSVCCGGATSTGSNGGSNSSADTGDGGSNNNAVIVGASVGAVLGFGLMGVAYLMGRRYSKRNNLSEAGTSEPNSKLDVQVEDSESYPASISTASPHSSPSRNVVAHADNSISYAAGHPDIYTLPPQSQKIN